MVSRNSRYGRRSKPQSLAALQMAGVEFIAAEKTERKFSALQAFEKSQNAEGIGGPRF
jgi:hypothetical protein